MAKIYGLIGYQLSHSFSKKYFTEKFQKENIADSQYELFELAKIEDLKELMRNNPEIKGLNITIPYKKVVIPYLSSLSESAQEVGAVNVIKIDQEGRLIGYNSDYDGFLQSLRHFLGENPADGIQALVLGTGGASQAVQAALKALNIEFLLVSRDVNQHSENSIEYGQLNGQIIKNHHLIINTTPLGMYPKTDSMPPIPYESLNPQHLLYDLVYNPEITEFLKKGQEKGAKIKGGLEMLHLQAEKAWAIWNE